MNNAGTKLHEARFFLSEMKRARSNPKAFVSNLQSFLSSARSVAVVVRKEYSNKPNFKEWFRKEQRRMLSDELYGFFDAIEEVRIREWGDPEEPQAESSITYVRQIFLQFPPHEGWRFRITEKNKPVWISPSGYEFDASEFHTVLERIYVFEKPPRAVLGVDLWDYSVGFLCDLYLASLTALVREANMRVHA